MQRGRLKRGFYLHVPNLRAILGRPLETHAVEREVAVQPLRHEACDRGNIPDGKNRPCSRTASTTTATTTAAVTAITTATTTVTTNTVRFSPATMFSPMRDGGRGVVTPPRELWFYNDLLRFTAGYNFGCGSSREQAATALQAAGVDVIVAGSFNATFERNAINNGLMVLECPELVEYLRNQYADYVPTRLVESMITLDLESWKVRLHDNANAFSVRPIGAPVQELLECGGLEAWVQQRLDKTSTASSHFRESTTN